MKFLIAVIGFYLVIAPTAAHSEEWDRNLTKFTISTLDGQAFQSNMPLARVLEPRLLSVMERCSVIVGMNAPIQPPAQTLAFDFNGVRLVNLYVPREETGEVLPREFHVISGYFFADDVNFGRAIVRFSRPDEDKMMERMIICAQPRVEDLLCHKSLEVFGTSTCRLYHQRLETIERRRRSIDSWEIENR